ncbi:MAG: ribbon-helix-helix domain-containing protein [Rhodospirillales bacterium]|nr:ribbon-helix-helix domain-containing protein [Alphaproteobacteria bacterium]USO03134.1 MAG: ribbon-helix-helix domain-containing protein [Rhodospirillales bacterium]
MPGYYANDACESGHELKSTLVSRNITVLDKRTSVRLEPEMWQALKDISNYENCSIHDLCSLISLRKDKKTSLTAAIRVFLMLYYRASSTEEGHRRAGHGNFRNMKIRAGMPPDWGRLETAFNGAFQKSGNGTGRRLAV